MKFEEALAAMREGNKIRLSYWHVGHYIYHNDGHILDIDMNVFKFVGYEIFSQDWEIYEEKPIEEECSYCDLFMSGKESIIKHISFHEKRGHKKIKYKQKNCLKQFICQICSKDITNGKVYAFGTHFCSVYCMDEFEKKTKHSYSEEWNYIKSCEEKINIIFEKLGKFEKRLDNLPYEFDAKFEEGQKWFDKAIMNFTSSLFDVKKEICEFKAFEREARIIFDKFHKRLDYLETK